MVYPVEGLGSDISIGDGLVEVDRDTMMDGMTEYIVGHFHLEDWGTNAAECLLCETKKGRIGKIFNYMFRVQWLFTFSVQGEHLVKRYGKKEWEVLSVIPLD